MPLLSEAWNEILIEPIDAGIMSVAVAPMQSHGVIMLQTVIEIGRAHV